MEFFETATGQVLAGAHKYLSAAKELRYSKTWMERPQLLQTPTIHLLAHGVELLLKYPLLAAGASSDDVRKRFGHDLVRLWNDDGNEVLRSVVSERSIEAWDAAKASGKWPTDNFGKHPQEEVKHALDQLDFLHGRASGFALRYVVMPNTRAPRPAFLIDVFGEVADRSLSNPGLLIQGR